MIVGDGPAASRIRALTRELAIEDVVILTGRVPHAQVERYYALIDVLVYPRLSNRVTELVTPLKPLEAMAQGKLVIASDVGGHREMVIPGRNGVLFKAGDASSLAKAAIDLLESTGPMARAARKRPSLYQCVPQLGEKCEDLRSAVPAIDCWPLCSLARITR